MQREQLRVATAGGQAEDVGTGGTQSSTTAYLSGQIDEYDREGRMHWLTSRKSAKQARIIEDQYMAQGILVRVHLRTGQQTSQVPDKLALRLQKSER